MRLGKWGLAITCVLLLAACSVSYKFNGASINYDKVHTIQIVDFPIRSAYVWGPMGPMFNNQLKDVFANHTRLQQVIASPHLPKRIDLNLFLLFILY